jgi:hypothetical protein
METHAFPLVRRDSHLLTYLRRRPTPEFRGGKNAWVLTAVPLVRRDSHLLTYLRRRARTPKQHPSKF